jgi:hypothetical protein
VKHNLIALIDSEGRIVGAGRGLEDVRWHDSKPVSVLRPDDDSRLARLVHEGILRPARRGAPKDLFATRAARRPT